MIKIFKNFFKKNIESSREEYTSILSKDINLNIRFKYRSGMYSSYVEKIDSSEIIFRSPDSAHFKIDLNIDKPMNISLISNNQLYTTEVIVKEKIIENDAVYYRCKINGPINQSKRRKHYRLPIRLNVEFYLIQRPAMKYKGNTVDISPDGMLLETFEDLMINKDIVIEVNIENKDYSLNGNILRRRVNYKNGAFLYNIKFDNVSTRNKNEITSFIAYKKSELKSKEQNSTEEKVDNRELKDNNSEIVVD